MAFEAAPERWILERLTGDAPGSALPDGLDDELLERWIRVHGVEGLVASRTVHASRRTVLGLQFELALHQLAAIGHAFAASNVSSVVLKGLPLAIRLYAEPSLRPSVDFDLLVLPEEMARAEAALVRLGYEIESGERGAFFRHRHFHIHVTAPGRVPVELHRLAYEGFGRALTAADLFEGRVPSPVGGAALFVPSPSRELVYLAVHAAGHRFSRIGWLYDIKRLLESCAASPSRPTEGVERTVEQGWDFATRTGFGGPLAATVLLLNAHFGFDLPILAPRSRAWLARAANLLADEPSSPQMRMATRIAYSLLLCEGLGAHARFAAKTVIDKIVIPTSE